MFRPLRRGAASHARRCSFGAASQHPEICSYNLETRPFLALFILPFSRLDASFDKDQRTLLQVLLVNFRLFAPDDDLVPLRTLLSFARPALIGFARGNRKVRNRLACAG